MDTAARGLLGGKLAKLLGSTRKTVAVDLLRFNKLLETGEIARTKVSLPAGAAAHRKKYDDFMPHKPYTANS
jgi:hypothetical protein